MLEMEGSWEKQKPKVERGEVPDFHLDGRTDTVERLIERVGWEDALTQIEENLQNNPDDAEARRQANLIVGLNERRMQKLKEQLQH